MHLGHLLDMLLVSMDERLLLRVNSGDMAAARRAAGLADDATRAVITDYLKLEPQLRTAGAMRKFIAGAQITPLSLASGRLLNDTGNVNGVILPIKLAELHRKKFAEMMADSMIAESRARKARS